jgi:hypothetical protein
VEDLPILLHAAPRKCNVLKMPLKSAVPENTLPATLSDAKINMAFSCGDKTIAMVFSQNGAYGEQ